MRFVKIQRYGGDVVDYACNSQGRGLYLWDDETLYTEILSPTKTERFKSPEQFASYIHQKFELTGKIVERGGWPKPRNRFLRIGMLF